MIIRACIALAVLWACVSHGQAAPAGTDAGVREALSRSSEVRVIALLDDAEALQHDRAALATQVDALLSQLPASGAHLERRYQTIAAVALTVDADGLAALERAPVVRAVSLDPGGAGQMLESGPLAEVDSVRSLGFAGAGRKVAVIDTGIRLDHQSFAGRVVDQACFCTGCCPNGGSVQLGAGAAADDHGHGTNVTGIAAGSAVAAVPAGAATAASIVAVKVLDGNNSYCCVSDVIAALDWLRVNHPDIAAVNLSLGSFALFPGYCDGEAAWTQALSAAVNGVAAAGGSVVACTANQGSSASIAAPACIANAMAVGAVWDSNAGSATVLGCTDATTAADKVTCFSNLSPVADLIAPGAWVTSAGLASPTAASTYAGTSMASPMVAGCLTQLREAFPRLPRQRLEAAVLASPVTVTRPPLTQRWPRLDCLDAFVRLDTIFAGGFD
jgi:subtilisin family serine protease